MFDYLEKLYTIIKKHNSGENYTSIFREISSVFYYENYHSDILAYYLKNEDVKYEFINWLNEYIISDKTIDIEEYYDGKVIREKTRIDVTLLNYNESKAIIIENKSNNAGDQFKQLFRYYSELDKKGINIEAILYLNKDSIKQPDLSSLNINQINEIKNVLVCGKLVGVNSFVENVINKVIANTDDIRLNGLSQEIREFFNYIVYGEMNMENMENFIAELNKNDNLNKLEKSIDAYNDIPKYLAKKYMEYINKHEIDFKPWFWRDWYIAIDVKKNRVNYTVDINFSLDNVKFKIFMRTGSEKYLLELKEKAGSNWIFNDEYNIFIEEPMKKDKEIKKILDKIILCLKCIGLITFWRAYNIFCVKRKIS
jgi:hypothetical protein